MSILRARTVSFLVTALLAGCGSGGDDAGSAAPRTDAEWAAQVSGDMHDSILAGIQELRAAAVDLQAAAPTPSGRGWDATADAQAIAAMKAAWVRTRTAYERYEGALAPLFPDIDLRIDARYDDFLTALNGQGDADPFDDQGVTGMHAIERILYSDVTPARVVTFEATLPGYAAARFPATEAEAAEFKTKLCARLITDLNDLESQWTPAHMDIGSAFQGLVALMHEQQEKVNKAASDEEESRYSQRTMVDLRDNLAGTKVVYALFQPWLLTKSSSDATRDGATIDARIAQGFDALGQAYAAIQGDAFPAPPSTWSAENPSSADLATPFGQLWSSVHAAVDPATTGSIVDEMNDSAIVLGFP